MQEISCTNNTTLCSQQTHRRSSISDLLSKFAKRKVPVLPLPPPRLLCRGDCYARGRGVVWISPYLILGLTVVISQFVGLIYTSSQIFSEPWNNRMCCTRLTWRLKNWFHGRSPEEKVTLCSARSGGDPSDTVGETQDMTYSAWPQ